MRWTGCVAVVCFTCLPALGGAWAASPESPAEDTAAPATRPEPGGSELLEIKFAESQEIRLRGGRPVDLRGRALTSEASRAVLGQVARGEWLRSHDVSEEELETMRTQGLRATGEALPDLNLYFRLRLPPGLDAEAVARQLRALPEVEAVYHVPAPAPLPVAPDYYTPSTGTYQRYLDPAPNGIGHYGVADERGALGDGLRICDVEYSYNASHAELEGITQVGPAPVDPFSNTHHGTAVAGIYGGLPDGQGITGIVPESRRLFAAAYTASGYNVGAAITACAANIGPGEIILIEQQTRGPRSTGISDCYGCVPPEWYKPTYDAIRIAVAADKIVVETAGNGSQDLDDPIYSTGNGGHHPFLPQNDSGAIIVGAGRSPTYGTSARSAHDYSNYGSTVDLQGWGDSIVTSGYGDLFSADGVNRYYTFGFGGTSGAGSIVAGAALSLQGYARSRSSTLTPHQLKAALRSTGTPQTGTKTIGPLPNLSAAFQAPQCDSGGQPYAGGCWYMGVLDQSCQEVCASRGGVSPVTASVVGTPAQGGSRIRCQQVLSVLGYRGNVSAGTRSDGLGLGCHRRSNGRLWWLQRPNFNPASKTRGGGAQLACACNH